MKRLLKSLILFTTIAASVVLCGSYFLSFISPETIGFLAFSWFVFPFLWVMCFVGFVVLLVFKRFLCAIILFAAMCLTWNGFSAVVSLFPNGDKCEGKPLRVLTYNTRMINYVAKIDESVIEEWIDFIDEVEADILFLQEFPEERVKYVFGVDNLHKIFPDYPYVITDKNNHGNGQVVISKYPITISQVDMSDELKRLALVLNVNVDGMTIRIANVHLQSISLSAEQIEAVSRARRASVDGTKQGLIETYRKMSGAFLNRAQQARELSTILTQTDVPVIVCGDFNDTPISYTYNTVSNGLHDAFIGSCSGWGNTYNGKLRPLRIDYIMYTDDFESANYCEHDVDLSDHYPVSADLYLRR